MFHKDFYPTPIDVVRSMIPTELFSPKMWVSYKVLEPSAWKWDILDYINWITKYKKVRLYAIEQSPELQSILKEKQYKVVHDDFLTYEKEMSFDFIIMNPPFSNGDEHFIKAWEISDNTTIVCLLNSETINNPYSEKRKLVKKIIEDNQWEVIDLWQCFRWSERTTGVNVSMVKVTKKVEKTGFEWDLQEDSKVNINEDVVSNEIATLDLIGNMINDFERVKQLFIDGTRALQKADRISKSISNNYWLKVFEIAWNEWSLQDRYDIFLSELKYGIWNKIAQEINIEKYMTSATRQNFQAYIREQGNVAISKDNIQKFVSLIFTNRWWIMEQAIQECFDHMTKFHDHNRIHIEWWKTNDCWKVNRKVIFPYWYEPSWTWEPRIAYKHKWILDDIDKAMCFLDGKQFENVKTIVQSIEESSDNLCYSEFFKIRYFKKGTIHIEFIDAELWNRFNKQACQWKWWLPPA
mgnify:FL=1